MKKIKRTIEIREAIKKMKRLLPKSTKGRKISGMK